MTTERDADSYYGNKAADYLTKRVGEPKWQSEERIVEEFLAKQPAGGIVLDVPFGTGRFAKLYLDRGMDVYGIDISDEMLSIARRELGETADRCHIQVGSADGIPFPDSHFDLIVSCRFFTLISLPMAKRVLGEFRRVGKGRVLINFRVKKKEKSALKRFLSGLGMGGGGSRPFKKSATEQDVVRLFTSQGFEVKDRKTIEENERSVFYFYELVKR